MICHESTKKAAESWASNLEVTNLSAGLRQLMDVQPLCFAARAPHLRVNASQAQLRNVVHRCALQPLALLGLPPLARAQCGGGGPLAAAAQLLVLVRPRPLPLAELLQLLPRLPHPFHHLRRGRGRRKGANDNVTLCANGRSKIHDKLWAFPKVPNECQGDHAGVRLQRRLTLQGVSRHRSPCQRSHVHAV